MQPLPKYISFLKENRTLEQAKEIYHQRIEDSQEVYNKFVKDFITRDCPICGSNKHEELERFNGQYGVVSCAKCASMFVNPSPNLEALDFYYNHCKCNEQLGSLLKERVGKKPNRELSMEDVVRKVSELSGISEQGIVGKSRKQEIVEARQTAMFLCRHILDSSLSSVGIYFGGRDHTTVMHAIKAVEKKQKEKIKIKDNIAQITQELSFISF